MVCCLGFAVWQWQCTPKVAYVRTSTIIEGYNGVKEARELYQTQLNQWQSQIETLRNNIDQTSLAYEGNFVKWDAKEQQRQKTELYRKQVELEKYETVLAEKSQVEEDKVFQGSINQINAYIEKYAKDKGYTFVLGTTQTGNILYADEAVDITNEVLNGLNQSYKK